MSENNDLFPWEDIAAGNIFESGVYLFEIAEFEDGHAASGKRMPKARFKCIEPANFANMAFFENYVVGTDEDPTAIVPGTMGARNMKAAFEAAQIPKGDSMSALMAASVGNQLILQLNKYSEVGGEYDGVEKNKCVGMYKIGERKIGLVADKTKKKGAGGPKPLAGGPTAPPVLETLICTTCGKPVPKDEYSAHVESCTW